MLNKLLLIFTLLFMGITSIHTAEVSPIEMKRKKRKAPRYDLLDYMGSMSGTITEVKTTPGHITVLGDGDRIIGEEVIDIYQVCINENTWFFLKNLHYDINLPSFIQVGKEVNVDFCSFDHRNGYFTYYGIIIDPDTNETFEMRWGEPN